MGEHLTEDELILRYYGEAADDSAGRHLEVCAGCREQYRRLQLVLNSVEMPIPEPGPEYEERVWTRLAPELKIRRWSAWLRPRAWAPAAAVAALLAVAFFTGRYTQPVPPPAPSQQASAPAPAVRERVLFVAVGDHLERSQMVLVELENQPASGTLNIAAERAVARDLVDANRLYRQTAAAAGEAGVATMLEDLERVLLDVAHSPEKISGKELAQIRQRIEAQGLLFKIRVLGTQIRDQENRPGAGTASL